MAFKSDIEIAREAVASEDFDLARIAYAKSVEYQPEASTIAPAYAAEGSWTRTPVQRSSGAS